MKKLTKQLLFIVCFVLINIQHIFGQEDAASQFFQNEATDSDENLDLIKGLLLTNLEDIPTTFIANSLGGNIGYTNIGGENFIGLRLNPELDFKKFGIGLDIPLWFNLNTKAFRTDIYTSGVGILRLIDYIRFGRKKQTKFYLKIGTLRYERLGFGFLLDNYTNARSYERRKVGVSLDILIKKIFGIELIYTDFNIESFNLLAARPYFRPLGRTNIPILKTLELGFSFIQDRDNTAELINNVSIRPRYINDGIQALGVDLGITFINTSFIRWVGYTQYGRLDKVNSAELQADFGALYDNYGAGSGFALGTNISINLILNTLVSYVRLERLFYSDNFIPQFFNSIYEINKDERVVSLLNATRKQGIYGSLYFNVLKTITGGGSLVIPDNVSTDNPAYLKISANVDRLGDKIILNALYTKGNIVKLSDAFKLDQNSLLRVRLAYKIYKFVTAGIDYYWTFASDENGNFKATNFIYPHIGVSIPFKKSSEK